MYAISKRSWTVLFLINTFSCFLARLFSKFWVNKISTEQSMFCSFLMDLTRTLKNKLRTNHRFSIWRSLVFKNCLQIFNIKLEFTTVNNASIIPLTSSLRISCNHNMLLRPRSCFTYILSIHVFVNHNIQAKCRFVF